MKSALLLVAAAAVLLAGCDQSPPSEPRRPITVRSDAQDQLHKLDDLNRAIGLKRAIHQSGYGCKRVDTSGYVQEHENLSMWTARCDDKREWAIFVGPDGTAQVRPCRDLAQLKLPACVVRKSPAQPS
ncbi:MAG: hypothetical protein H0V46_04615 [Sphingomonas sp.]|nr:hypothetical protein [Sphingomonas sp.]